MNIIPELLPARSDRTYTARMHELLARNDRESWNNEYSRDLVWVHEPVNARTAVREWIEDHMVHAVEHCPDIVALWTEMERVPGYQHTRHVTTKMRFIAQGLQGLDEEAKIRLFQGQCEGKAQQTLYEHLVTGTSLHRTRWTHVCSPAWVGEPGSALRRAAEDAGWKAEYLPLQVARFIVDSRAQAWACKMPYPHSVAVLAWVDEALKSIGPTRGEAVVQKSEAWADAKDIALSQLLCAYAPVELNRLWQAHPNAPSIAPEDAKAFLSVVKMHMALGMWQELGAAVVAGNVLDCSAPQMAYPLPELDGPAA